MYRLGHGGAGRNGRVEHSMRVLLSGGGSGGHIYPALAIARGLLLADPKTELLYVGTNHGLERDIVPREHMPFQTIHARGLLVRGIRGKALGALTAVRGLVDAIRIIRHFRPDVVVGTGGYVSGPVGLAAHWMHIPLVIQEQNAWPGLTNRSLAKRAYAVLVPFAEAIKHFPEGTRVVLAGNPIDVPSDRLPRHEARERLGLDPAVRLLMATGGSQGADAVNRLMMTLLPEVIQDPGLGIIWATGKRYYRDVSAEIEKRWPAGLDPRRIRIFEYFFEIQDVYQAADLFVGRAGAMTLTDCEAFAVPVVLIPSPNVSEDHQTKNAKVIEDRGAGISIAEKDLLERAPEVVALLRDETRRREMARNISALFDAQALDRILQAVRQAPGSLGR